MVEDIRVGALSSSDEIGGKGIDETQEVSNLDVIIELGRSDR